jgi:hypothetical protein
MTIKLGSLSSPVAKAAKPFLTLSGRTATFEKKVAAALSTTAVVPLSSNLSFAYFSHKGSRYCSNAVLMTFLR